jgi:hypothetical protein
MIPGKYNFICPQGATFSKELVWTIGNTPVNLTGYTARMQVRENFSSSNFIINLTTENGGITFGVPVLGSINLLINAATTSTFVPKKYLYDLELSSNSVVTRLIQGEFIVTAEVTR